MAAAGLSATLGAEFVRTGWLGWTPGGAGAWPDGTGDTATRGCGDGATRTRSSSATASSAAGTAVSAIGVATLSRGWDTTIGWLATAWRGSVGNIGGPPIGMTLSTKARPGATASWTASRARLSITPPTTAAPASPPAPTYVRTATWSGRRAAPSHPARCPNGQFTI